MSGISFTRHLISCNGCGAIYGTRIGFESLTEARASAYTSGWRFPNWLTANGTASINTADICPKCVPSWQPKPRAERAASHRALTAAEIAALPS